jgi:hypothetical protein
MDNRIANKLSIGSILIDTATGENLGAVVNIIPSTRSIIVFRVDKKVHPTFSKISIDSLLTGGIMVNGSINHAANNDLKLNLLKYYRTRNLTPTEVKGLEAIMLYAFPNAIPEYKTDAAVSAEIIKHTNLRDKIRPGAAFYINTTENSKYPHLDNKTVWVVKGDNKGVWVCDDLKCVHQPSFTHIQYKDIDTPTFYGVSKMMESGVTTPNFNDDFAGIKGVFGKLESDKTLLSQIIHDGVRMKVDPAQNNLIVTPHKYAGQCYDFNQGRVCNIGGDTASANDARAQLYNNEPISSYGIKETEDATVTEQPFLLKEDPGTLDWVNKLAEFKVKGQHALIDHNSCNIKQMGSGNSDKGQESTKEIGDAKESGAAELDPELAELIDMGPGERGPGGDTEDEFGSDFEEFEPVSDADVQNITEYGTVQKIRQVAVPELERTFKESILRGHIKKQREENLPVNLRRMYQSKINKEVNMISLIKSQVTLENKSVKLPLPDYKPLAANYLMRNFTHNNFLIPLVISTRKIFLTKKDKVGKDDFNTVNTQVTEDYLKYISDIEKEKQSGGNKRLINLDEELGRQSMVQAPYVTSQSNIGLLIRMGEKYSPESGQNPDTTPKLKMDRAVERIEQNEQQALVIQYGQKPYEIDSFGMEKTQFDSFVALGPLSRFIGDEKREYTVTELEEMEEQIDKNVESVSSQYKMYYYGDNLNLVGFVRPPVNSALSGEDGVADFRINGSMVSQLMNEDNIIICQLNKLDDEVRPLDEPDKYILYMFPGLSSSSGGKSASRGDNIHINEEHLKEYLDKAVPTINDIVELYSRTWSIDNSSEMFRLFDILGQFDYYYPSNERDMTSYSRGEAHHISGHAPNISYDDYDANISKLEAKLVSMMSDYSSKLDKVIKLKTYKNKKQRERKGLSVSTPGNSSITCKVQVVTDDLIELADKIYGEKFADISGGPDNMISKTDEYRLDYYSKQDPDNSRLMNLLIRQKAFNDTENMHNKEKLENTLFILKNKYESLSSKARADIDMLSLPSSVSAKLKTCSARMDRKPKIIRYVTMDRLKEDNGKVVTNTRGEVIMTGDYAVVDDKTESGAGEKKVFKREQLVDGDYWIAQPIEVLESLLLKKKRESCETDMDNANKAEMHAKMKLPGEQLVDTASDPANKKELTEEEIATCTFNPDKIVCLPAELSGAEQELRELETRIKDVKAQLDFITNVPVLQADTKQKLASVENEVRSYIMGLTSLNKYYEDKHLADQKFLEEIIKRRKDCAHFQVTDYFLGLRNLTDMEKFGLAKQIIDRFQNTEQVDTLILDKFDHEEPKHNNIECYICQQTLMCKHYAYAIKLLETGAGNILDEEPLITVYGEENCGSIYCKSCGAQIANAAVLDVEEFEKSGDKEGMHVQTREVLEEINFVEKQKKAIENIVNEALIGGDDNDDLKMKIRIYQFLKDLCSLKMLSIDDELEMINFAKSYSSGITRKAFYNKFALTFLRAGKQVAAAVIDKLAMAEYWKYVTADIMSRFLVTLQTSKQIYKVYNKLISCDYMGWPMIGHGNSRDTETGGIDMLFGLSYQMALAPDFEYLNGGSGTIEGFRAILISRMDELIKSDELVRSRLERALDDKYRQITIQEEREGHITNFWPLYKPAMVFNTAVGWTPAHDITKSVLTEWTGKTLAKITDTTRENMVHQAQMLKHNITSEIKKQQPKTRLTLATSVGNSCCPLDFNSKTDGAIKSQSDVNYYHYLLKANESIQANLTKIRGYADILHELDCVLKERLLVINMPPQPALYAEIVLNITLTETMVKDYFLKYIDIGINKGEPHLFDPFGRCLISNQLKTDVTAMNYAQSDFEKLLISVYQKTKQRDILRPEDPDHLLDPAKYEASQLVIKLISHLTVLAGELGEHIGRDVVKSITKIKTNIHSALAPKLIEEVHYEPECMSKISALVADYECIINAVRCMYNNNHANHTHHTNHTYSKAHSHLPANKLHNFGVYINDMLELINKSLYDVVLEYLKTGILSRDAFKFVDAKKEYYGLITKIDTESQAFIEDIISELGLSKKEESDLESFLLNMGELKDIKADYKGYLEKRENMLARVDYANIDYETERQSRLTQAGMVGKHVRDMRIIISHLKNRSWQPYKTSGEMQDTHYVEFFKYKDNAKLFDKAYEFTNLFNGVLGAIKSGDIFRVIGPDIQVAMYQNLFLLCVLLVLTMSGVNKHKEHTLVFTTSDDMDEGKGKEQALGFADKMKQTMTSKAEHKANSSATALTDMYEPGVVRYEVSGKDKSTSDERDILDEPSLLKGDELDEFSNEPGDELFEDDDELHVSDFATKLIKAQRTQKEILVNFVVDFMQFIKSTEHVYNEMSLTNIAEQKAKTVEKQKRKNLGAFKALRQEGMENDYRLIQLKMSMGELDISGLHAFMVDYFGDSYDAGDPDTNAQDRVQSEDYDEEGGDLAQGEEQGRRNRLGLDDYEMEELGFVGAAEDMEDMDYGYLGVAEE